MSTTDPPKAPSSDKSPETSQSDKNAPDALAPMDFSTFVMSLGSSAMVNLGKIPAPGQQKINVDLPAAKQMIDILGILEEKTRGNLNESEEKLLQSLLYDLRVQFVDAQKAHAKK